MRRHYRLNQRNRRIFGVNTALWVMGLWFGAIGAFAAVSPEANQGCLPANCHGSPGAKRTMANGSVKTMKVDLEELSHSAHKERACIECHTDIDTVPHSPDLKRVNCENCHYQDNPKHAPFVNQFREYAESIHGRGAKEGDKKAPGCSACHGAHDIQGPEVASSRVHRKNQPTTCGECHEKEKGLFVESRHGTELMKGNLDVPTCARCHGVHKILEPENPESSVFRGHVAETCAGCHEAVEVVGKYGYSAKRVQTYQGSFHGFANKYGDTVVANCASCHTAHLILPPNDPRSSIHSANLKATCGQTDCHPTAVAAFASGQVHLGVAEPEAIPVRLLRTLYTLMIAGIIGGMALHNLFDLRAQWARRRKHAPR